MADIRESFPTLEDATGVGAPLSKSQEGDAASGKVGSVGFAFKDSSGNLILPQLDAAGKVPVTFTAGTPKRARGTASGSLTQVTVATLTLTTSLSYSDISVMVACRRGANFEISWNDNGTPTILGNIIVDSGQYSFDMFLENLQVTAGATGTQQILVKALNFDKASDFYATIVAVES
jgi:hypothetical protein